MPLCSRSGCRVLRVREAHVRDVKDATLGIQGSGQLYLLSFEECRQLLIIELIEGPIGVVFEYQLLARPGYSALKCPLLLRGLWRCLLLFSHTCLLRALQLTCVSSKSHPPADSGARRAGLRDRSGQHYEMDPITITG